MDEVSGISATVLGYRRREAFLFVIEHAQRAASTDACPVARRQSTGLSPNHDTRGRDGGRPE
jgi:hypothetical protein